MALELDYALRVTRELGLSGESSCVDREKPLRVYIAVDGTLPGHPDRDVALLWTKSHGWAIAVEEHGGADLTVVAHMGGAVEPPPRTVARWARRMLAQSTRPATVHPAAHSGHVA
ncbi:hypothetical protein SAMN05216188_10657 [Lentzea xinjiangensis]|uniref:DUF6292 domain-containing protein n=1 Tax=Lentzea xinjiangensis TaxID=402600 RepID=A0A1H9JM47_9PSEU|nr:DUF6292 family protein [Lentzea xinjiangensis]SEQ87906.1 hypothetical protein SAMN05216188_10657 [Lentzea xinjiangensis]